MIKVVCISDTHGYHRKLNLPDGDILVHAGDMTGKGSLSEIEDVIIWFKSLLIDKKYQHIVFISGNHDFSFQQRATTVRQFYRETPGLHYLQDKQVEIMGLKIYGTPWNPWFHDWAWNLERGSHEMKAVWSLLPPNLDILVTHSPPYGYNDLTLNGTAVGCRDQLSAVLDKKPKYIVCGHIHESYGQSEINVETDIVKVYNVATCNRSYQPVNKPIILDI